MQQRLEAHDLTNTQLGESYWIVTHWKKIERGVIFFLYVVIALMFGFSLFIALKIYALDSAGTRRMTDELKARVGSVLGAYASPAAVEVEPLAVLTGGRDSVVPLRNPNEEWMASFDLIFSSGGAVRARRPMFLYPSQKKYAVQEGSSIGDSPTVTLENVAWTRLSARERADVAEKKHFTVDQFLFTSADGMSRARFTIKNESVQNYWNVEVPVVLFSGSTVTAADSVTLDHLDAGETRQVWVTIFGQLGEPSSTSIEPDVNIFDPSAYREQSAPLQRLR